jgi:hypothetical protein
MLAFLMSVAGGVGFEPTTPNLGGWCSIRPELLAHRYQPLRKSNSKYTKPSPASRGKRRALGQLFLKAREKN